jgi:hypothetical protein
MSPGTYYALVRAYSDGTTGSFTVTINAPAELATMGGPGLPGGGGFPPGGGVTPPMQTPFYPPGSAIAPQTHRGVVASVSGPAPVAAGATCNVFITGETSSGRLNCRVRAICNGNVIYGRDAARTRYGYSRCAVTSGPAGQQNLEAHDTGPSVPDGDPMMDLNTAAGQVTISDQTPAGSWSVVVRFVGPGGGTSI